jgi:DNA-binding MarR family transcriptional regulator
MPGLSVPQFRALGYLSKHPRASLSEVAEHLGLTLPSTSKLIQNLVSQKVVARRQAADRRQVCLSLTQVGSAALDQARLETQQKLADSLSSVDPADLAVISAALQVLSQAFSEGNLARPTLVVKNNENSVNPTPSNPVKPSL